MKCFSKVPSFLLGVIQPVYSPLSLADQGMDFGVLLYPLVKAGLPTT